MSSEKKTHTGYNGQKYTVEQQKGSDYATVKDHNGRLLTLDRADKVGKFLKGFGVR